MGVSHNSDENLGPNVLYLLFCKTIYHLNHIKSLDLGLKLSLLFYIIVRDLSKKVFTTELSLCMKISALKFHTMQK